MKNALLLLSVFILLSNLLIAQTLEINGNGNLRSGPGITNEVIGKVTIGMKVVQIDYSNDWYKIELPNKSFGWIYKTLIKSEKQGKIIVQQRPDTIQLVSNAIAEEIRGLIQRHMKNNFFNITLSISSVYPLEINLSHKTDGNTSISGRKDSITFTGNITLKTIEGIKAISYPKAEIGQDENSRPALMTNSSMIIKDYSTSTSNSNSNVRMFTLSGSSIDNENNVQCIKSGKFECSGNYFVNKTISVFFESGTIVFTDDQKPCTFSEGSIISFNSVIYKYANLKWVNINVGH